MVDLLKESSINLVPVLFFFGYRLCNILIYIKVNSKEGTSLKTIQHMGAYHGKILVLLGIACTILLGISCGNLKRIHHFYTKNKFPRCKKYILEDGKLFVAIWMLFLIVFLAGGEKLLQFIFQKSAQLSREYYTTIACGCQHQIHFLLTNNSYFWRYNPS